MKRTRRGNNPKKKQDNNKASKTEVLSKDNKTKGSSPQKKKKIQKPNSSASPLDTTTNANIQDVSTSAEEAGGAQWLVTKLRSRIDTEEGSLEKISLASQFFHSSEMIMFNKDFFLLQWLVQTMIHSEKRPTTDTHNINPEFVSLPYWTLLKDIVSIPTPFKPPSAPFPNQKDYLRLVLSASTFCISSPSQDILLIIEESFRALFLERVFSFRPTIDIYTGFLSSLLSAFISCFATEPEVVIVDSLVSLLATALQLFIEIKRLHTNQRKNFTLVVSKFLEPFVILRFLFARSGYDQRYPLIVEHLDGILMKTLFPNSARLFEYSLAFSFDRESAGSVTASAAEKSNESEAKKGRKGKGQGTYKGTSISSYRKLLFDKLRELVKNDTPLKEERYLDVPKHLIACHCLPYILDGFLEAFQHFYAAEQIKRRRLAAEKEEDDPLNKEQTNRHLEFNFYLELQDILNPYLLRDIKQITSSTDVREFSEGLQSYKNILSVMIKYDVYKDNFDPEKIQLGYFFKAAQRCIEQLTSVVSQKSSTVQDLAPLLFYCLSEFLQLSHYTIEPHLGQLWRALWTGHEKNHTPEASVQFMVLLLQTYTKLRQFDSLLSSLFDSLLSEADQGLNLGLLYSEPFLKEFSRCIPLLPVGKIPIVWQLFLTELSEKYVPALTEIILARTEATEKKHNKSKAQPTTEQLDGGIFRAFSQVVHLFVSYLESVMILNENALTLLDLTSKTCAELLDILLPLALGLNPALLTAESLESSLQRRGTGAPNFRMVYDVLSLYVVLSNVWSRTTQYPASRLSDSTYRLASKSCFPLLGDRSAFGSVSLSLFRNSLRAEANALPSLRFVLDLMSVRELRELHIAQQFSLLHEKVGEVDAMQLDPQDGNTLPEQLSDIVAHLSEEVISTCSGKHELQGDLLAWDGILASIDNRNYPIALWKLVTENIDILSPHLSRDQLQEFLQILLLDHPPLPNFDESQVARDTAATWTFRAINNRAVCQARFYELHPIRQVITSTLLAGISSVFLDLCDDGTYLSPPLGHPEESARELLRKSLKLSQEGDDLDFKKFIKATGIKKAFAGIFGNKKGKSKKKNKKETGNRKEQKETERPSDTIARVRQVLDLMLAFPSQYFIEEHKWCCCTVVLIIDFLAYRMRKRFSKRSRSNGSSKKKKQVGQNTDEEVDRELILLSCACRQMLSSFVPVLSARYDEQAKSKASQWRLIITDDVLMWLLKSINTKKNAHIPARLNQQLLHKTLAIQLLYCRILMKEAFVQTRNEILNKGELNHLTKGELSAIVRLLLDSLVTELQRASNPSVEAMVQRILLPLRCLTGFIDTIVEELQYREDRCKQKENFSNAALIEEGEEEGEGDEGNTAKGKEKEKKTEKQKAIKRALKRCFFIPAEYFSIMRQLEDCFLLLYTTFSSSERLAIGAQAAATTFTTPDDPTSRAHRGIQAAYFGSAVSFYEGILAFKKLTASKFLGNKAQLNNNEDQKENGAIGKKGKENSKGAKDKQGGKKEEKPKGIFMLLGNFLAFTAKGLTIEFCRNESTTTVLKEQSRDWQEQREELVVRLLGFIRFVCENLAQFRPKFCDHHFCLLFGLLQRLLQHCFATGGTDKASRAIEASYLSLLDKASNKDLGLVGEALISEMSPSRPVRRLTAAAYAADLILAVEGVPRIARLSLSKRVDPIVQHLASAIDRVFVVDSVVYTPEVTKLIVLSLKIITQLITNKSFGVGQYAVAVAFRALVPFTSQSPEFINRGKTVERLRQQKLKQAEKDREIIGQKRKLSTLLSKDSSPDLAPSSHTSSTAATTLPEPIFLAIYNLLFKCLVYKPNETIACMPSFISAIRYLMVCVFQYDQDNARKQKLLCAENLTRLLEEMTKQPKTFNKYVAYLLMDYILLVEANPLSAALKATFLPGVYALMDIGTDFEYRLVYRVLNATGKAVFKKIYDEYNRDWKYVGNA